MTSGNRTLFDPVGWSRNVVGSTPRFLVFAFLHVFVWILLVKIGGERMIVFVVFLTIFPIYYLYALKRLLQELDLERQE